MKTKQNCDGLYKGKEFAHSGLLKEAKQSTDLSSDSVFTPCDIKANLRKAIFHKSKKRSGQAKRLSLKQAEQSEQGLTRQSKKVVSPRCKMKRRPRKPHCEMQSETKRRKCLDFHSKSDLSTESFSNSDSLPDSLSNDSNLGLDGTKNGKSGADVNFNANSSSSRLKRNNRAPGCFWFWVDLDERKACESSKKHEDDFDLVLSVDDCGPCQRIIPTFENNDQSVINEEGHIQGVYKKRTHAPMQFLNDRDSHNPSYYGNKITSCKSEGGQTTDVLNKPGFNKYSVLPNIKGSYSEQNVDTGAFLCRMRERTYEPKVKPKYSVLPNINGTMYNSGTCTDDEAEETVDLLSWRDDLIKPLSLKKYPVLPNIKESYSSDSLAGLRSPLASSEDDEETIAFFLGPQTKEEQSCPEICASVDPFAKSRLRPPSERRLPPINDQRMNNVARRFRRKEGKKKRNPSEASKKNREMTDHSYLWKMEEATKDHQSTFRDVVLRMRQHGNAQFFDDTEHQKKGMNSIRREKETIYK